MSLGLFCAYLNLKMLPTIPPDLILVYLAWLDMRIGLMELLRGVLARLGAGLDFCILVWFLA